MELKDALRSKVVPTDSDPIDVVITSYKEGLTDVLQTQIRKQKRFVYNRQYKDLREFFNVTTGEPQEQKMVDEWFLTNVERYKERTVKNLLNITRPASGATVLKNLMKKKVYKPVEDYTVKCCSSCCTQFTMFNRKHHCRSCGKIYCNLCSQWKEIIPEKMVCYTNTEKWIDFDKPERVCHECKLLIDEYKKISKIVQYMEIVCYDIPCTIRLSTLSQSWYAATSIYLSGLRDMMHSFPSEILTEQRKKYLESNIENGCITGHSKWILQYLKSGNVPPDVCCRKYNCDDLLCGQGCTESLTIYDCIIVLNNSSYNLQAKMYAIECMIKSQNMPNYLCNFLPTEEVVVQDYILKNSYMFPDFFWLSRVNVGTRSDIFKNKLLLCNTADALKYQESLDLISHLEKNTGLNDLSCKLQTLKFPFLGPFGTIYRIEYDITSKISATKPIQIKYLSDTNEVKTYSSFLYKKEDVRKDSIIVSVVKLMYDLCKDKISNIQKTDFLQSSAAVPIPNKSYKNYNTENWTPQSLSPNSPQIFQNDVVPVVKQSTEKAEYLNKNYLVTYGVIPTSPIAGFIEIVKDSLTLNDILSNGSIPNYLYRPNIDKKVIDISNNYSVSLAFWTVATYLLGVGDRHLENIMITGDGLVFHIDYGFVFGADSTASFIRLDKNLIEGLGGSNMYESFKSRCCDIYCCLRDYFPLICSCLFRLSNINPKINGYNLTDSYIENFLSERFMVGLSSDDARSNFSNIIDKSKETFMHKVSDAIHGTVSSVKTGVTSWWI